MGYHGGVKKAPYRPSPAFLVICGLFLALSVIAYTLPYLAVYAADVPVAPSPFPVSVDPKTKTIVERDRPVALYPLSLAAALQAVGDVTQLSAAALMSTRLYVEVAGSSTPKAVTIDPGMRKEEVAQSLTRAFNWSDKQKQIFLKAVTEEGAGEGRLYPSTYIFAASTTPAEAYALIRERFAARVGARYATSTEELVPLNDALTIASIVEREAGTAEEMPIIAGILWNRLFADMRLQMDSTLQYARGTSRNGWWPVPRSKDKYIKSDFNTYQTEGLPPAPIASPSVPAILAALNPAKTECYYFFHSKGTFYCFATYEEHVAKLKQIYGRGR